MRKRKYLVLGIIGYTIAILILLFYLMMEFRVQMTEMARLGLMCVMASFMYVGGFCLSKYYENNKPMKINLYVYFVLYLVLLITLTLFDSLWLRNGFNFQGFTNLEERVNLMPFETIMTFIQKFDSMYSTSQVMLNLFGNVCAFMPMAFFLPLLFKKQNKFRYFVITMVLMILGIEFLQLVTGSGRFDVDDLILNLSGAVLAYLILKVRSVDDLIHNIFLLQHNKISRKSYIKMGLFVLIVVCLFIGLIKYRNMLYDKNYEEYDKINHPNITFEYNDECTSNNLFYENEIYKYYFECYDNNEFYLIVNNEDKFQVKEFLDDSKYNYDIGMLLTVFDYSDIDYKIKNKYPHFNLSVNNEIGNSYFGPSDVESDIAKLVLTDKSTDGYNLNFEVNIIPKNSGERVMNIDFEFTDASGKITVVTKKVKIIVDDDMNVEYSLE